MPAALYSYNENIADSLWHAATQPHGVSIEVAVRAKAANVSREEFVLQEERGICASEDNMRKEMCKNLSYLA
jgi:hypothetical protein